MINLCYKASKRNAQLQHCLILYTIFRYLYSITSIAIYIFAFHAPKMLLILRFSLKKIYFHAVFIIFLFMQSCINLFLNPQNISVCLNFRAEIEEQERFAITPSLFFTQGIGFNIAGAFIHI